MILILYLQNQNRGTDWSAITGTGSNATYGTD